MKSLLSAVVVTLLVVVSTQPVVAAKPWFAPMVRIGRFRKAAMIRSLRLVPQHARGHHPSTRAISEVLLLRGGGDNGNGNGCPVECSKLAVTSIAALLAGQSLLAEWKPAMVARQHFSDFSPQGSFIVRVLTANVLTWVAWAVCLLLVGDSSSSTTTATALTALGIVNTVDALRTFAIGDIERCQLDPAGQYFMLITPLIATYAGWTKASWGVLYLKLFMGAYILDGVVAANQPSLTAKVFFGPNHTLSENSLTILKNTGWWILAVGVSGMALAFGVEPKMALACGLGCAVVAGVDILARTNQKKAPVLLWTIVDALAVLAMTMCNSNSVAPPSV